MNIWCRDKYRLEIHSETEAHSRDNNRVQRKIQIRDKYSAEINTIRDKYNQRQIQSEINIATEMNIWSRDKYRLEIHTCRDGGTEQRKIHIRGTEQIWIWRDEDRADMNADQR